MSADEEDDENQEQYRGLFDTQQQQPQQHQHQQQHALELQQQLNGAPWSRQTTPGRFRHTAKSQWSFLAHRLAVYGRTTSMPGVNRLSEASSRASRLYWCLLGLLGSCFCIYHVAWLIYAFETSPVSSVLRQGATHFVFPDITICSMTPTDATLIRKHINARSKLQYFYQHILIPPLRKNLVKIRSILHSEKLEPQAERKLRRLLRMQSININASTEATAEARIRSIKQFFKLLRGTFNMYPAGYSLDSLVIRCKFEGRDCEQSEMTLSSNSHLWNCYTMRPKHRKVTSEEGLDLFILTHQQHYTEESDNINDTDCSFNHTEYDWATLNILSNWSTDPFWKMENFKGLITNALLPRYDSNGIRVAIHEEKTFPHSGQSSFTIDSGKQANMEIRMLNLSKLNHRKSHCMPKREIINYRQASMHDRENFVDTPFLRTPEDDMVQTYQKLLYAKCSCYSHEVPVRSTLPAEALCFNISTSLFVMLDVLNSHFNWTIDYNRLETYKPLENFKNVDVMRDRVMPVLLRNGTYLDALTAAASRMLCHEKHSRELWNQARQAPDRLPNCDYNEYLTSYSVTDWPRLKDIPYLIEEDILASRENNCMIKKNLFVDFEDRDNWVTTAKRVRENVIRVVVRPVTLSSDMYLEQQSYSVWQVVGELGGVLGLWSGLTFTGICELLELLAEMASSLCLILIYKMRRRVATGVSEGLG